MILVGSFFIAVQFSLDIHSPYVPSISIANLQIEVSLKIGKRNLYAIWPKCMIKFSDKKIPRITRADCIQKYIKRKMGDEDWQCWPLPPKWNTLHSNAFAGEKRGSISAPTSIFFSNLRIYLLRTFACFFGRRPS